MLMDVSAEIQMLQHNNWSGPSRLHGDSKTIDATRWPNKLASHRLGDLGHWMLLYWEDPNKYCLLLSQTDDLRLPVKLFRLEDLPQNIKVLFKLCNNLKIGSARGSGVS